MDRGKIDSNIAKWLELESWNFEKLNEPEYYSVYKVNHDQNTGFMVGLEKVVDRVDIFTKIKFSEDDRTKYLLSPDKLKFWIDLKINLMLMRIGTQIDPPDNPERLKSIRLVNVIYFDGLTHDKFIDTANKISDGLGLCNIMWKKFIDSVTSNPKK